MTNFIRPGGKSEIILSHNVYHEDAEFIKRNRIKISTEDTGIEFIVWFNDGKHVNDDPSEDFDEITLMALGRSCQDTIKQGIELVKARNPKMI